MIKTWTLMSFERRGCVQKWSKSDIFSFVSFIFLPFFYNVIHSVQAWWHAIYVLANVYIYIWMEHMRISFQVINALKTEANGCYKELFLRSLHASMLNILMVKIVRSKKVGTYIYIYTVYSQSIFYIKFVVLTK